MQNGTNNRGSSRCMLAAYDPVHSVAKERYWPWRHESLPVTLLDRFYHTVAANCLPENPNQLGPNDIHGGCGAVDETWCCWFRFLNGGRDQHGRPERFVILCGFVRREDMAGRDWSGVLESGPFADWAGKVLPCPLPKPAPLEYEYDPPVANVDTDLIARLAAGEALSFSEDDARQRISAVCSYLAERGKLFQAVMTQRNGVTNASVRTEKAPSPALPPSTEPVAAKASLEPERLGDRPRQSISRLGRISGSLMQPLPALLSSRLGCFLAGLLLGLLLGMVLTSAHTPGQ